MKRLDDPDNKAVRAKEMNAYLMDSQGIDRDEIAQKLCIQKGTVDKWVAKVKNALQISIDHTAEARRRHKAMLSIADKALLEKLPDDNRLLTEFYKGTGTWTNKHEITGTLAHIGVKELIDIIKQESTGSPALRDIEDSLVDDAEYDIVDEDSPQDNEIRLKNGNKIFTNGGDEPLQSGYDSPQEERDDEVNTDDNGGRPVRNSHAVSDLRSDTDKGLTTPIQNVDVNIPEGSTSNTEGVGIILESNKTLSPSLKKNILKDTLGRAIETEREFLKKSNFPERTIYNPETGETITDPERINALLGGSATLNPDMAKIYDERMLKFAKGEITLDEARSGGAEEALEEQIDNYHTKAVKNLEKTTFREIQDHATNCTQETEGSEINEESTITKNSSDDGQPSGDESGDVGPREDFRGIPDSQLHAESELNNLPPGHESPLCDCEVCQKGSAGDCKAKTSVSPPDDTLKGPKHLIISEPCPTCGLLYCAGAPSPKMESVSPPCDTIEGSGANPFTPTPDKIAEKLAGLPSDGDKMRFIALVCDEFHIEKNGYCSNREYKGDTTDETQINSCKYMGCPFATGMRLSFYTGEPVKFHKPLKYGRKARKGRKRKVAPLKFVGE